jgi:hypothetical protein
VEERAEKPRRRKLAAIVGGLVVVAAAVFLIGCCCTRPRMPAVAADQTPATAYEPPPGVLAPDSITLTRMQNVRFRIDPNLAMNIRRLEGEMRPHAGNPVINFGDPGSFLIDIESAEVGMTDDDLPFEPVRLQL